MSKIGRKKKGKIAINAPTQKKKKTTKPAKKTTAAEKKKANLAAAKRRKKQTGAEKEHDAKRAKVLKERREGKTGKTGKKPAKTIKQRLAERQDAWKARQAEVSEKANAAAETSKTREAAHTKWLASKQKVEASNLTKRYENSRRNIAARKKARLATLKKRKPAIKDGKIVVPKVAAVVAKTKKFKPAKFPKKPAILLAKKGKKGGKTPSDKPAGTKPKPAGGKKPKETGGIRRKPRK